MTLRTVHNSSQPMESRLAIHKHKTTFATAVGLDGVPAIHITDDEHFDTVVIRLSHTQMRELAAELNRALFMPKHQPVESLN